MPYGTASEDTKVLVARKMMNEAGVKPEHLIIEPELPSFEDMTDSECEEYFNKHSLYNVAVIIDGALDEEFTIEGIYEVNVADWIADDIEASHPDKAYEVIVSEFVLEDAGSVHYRRWK